VDGSAFFAISPSNSLQKSSAIQKISVTLLSVIMIQYLLFDTSKLLNISDITKRIGSFFKLPIQLFYGVPYPELAYKDSSDENRSEESLFYYCQSVFKRYLNNLQKLLQPIIKNPKNALFVFEKCTFRFSDYMSIKMREA